MKMKRNVVILILAMVLMVSACGSNEGSKKTIATESEVNKKTIIESTESENPIVYYWNEYYEEADFGKFNTPASENGLDYSLIWVEGKVIDTYETDNNLFSYIIQDANMNEWVTFCVNPMVDVKIGDSLAAYGVYLGVSNVLEGRPIFMLTRCLFNEKLINIEDSGIKIYSAYEGYSLKELQKLYKEPETAETNAPVTKTVETSASENQDQLNTAPTMGEKNALNKAEDYLKYTAFSHQGLVMQLEYEGFSTDEATYAANNCDADWNEQAAKKAQDYINYSSFSRSGLIEQLEYEGFTAEQAEYGVVAIGY